MTREKGAGPTSGLAVVALENEPDEDPVHVALREKWAQAETSVAALFGSDGQVRRNSSRPSPPRGSAAAEAAAEESAKTSAPPKKAARQIDDDYGDDEDDDEEEEPEKVTPLKAKGKAAPPNGRSPYAVRSPAPAVKPTVVRTSTTSSSDQGKSSEDVRKQLEEDKKAAAEAAKKSFQAMFYTLEHDRDAMLEQQKLDELDREVENEISGGPNTTPSASQNATGSDAAPTSQGTLGSADLGASSLTLKHLIARIDQKRIMVKASDNQLRTLISEVRKGRSKWASEDRVGQEELYEAAEKVLMELKAMTEYAQPFLQRVNKRDAHDYYAVIHKPMDIGSMIKKLKQLAYKSKKDFVEDLNLIWSNCLKYNSHPEHPFRKKALYMRKETDKLTPLIPDVVVRDRAEVEAEERRQHSLDADDSDEDDAPIMASRGRKAPKKGSKGAPSTTRKAPSVAVDDMSTPDRDMKPAMHASASNLRNEFLRADSEMLDASSAGFATPPPPGSIKPEPNGALITAPGSVADATDVDGVGNSVISAAEEAEEDDTEFKTWKQVTKKDRATAAAERSRLFRGEHLNVDEPALLRSKAGMRRWQRQQKIISDDKSGAESDTNEDTDAGASSAPGETLAEGIEKDEDSTLPDYYNPLSAIPDLDERWKWTTDSDGNVVPQSDDWMRLYPKDQYKSIAQGSLTKKMDANIRQMQDTRKICSKIGIVKQMQLQGQTYQNQFQKYEPQPFVEQDVGAVVVSENGPLMAPWVNRAALQRSVGKIFYHAGFEDFQPSALDMVTDVASQYFTKLTEGFRAFREQSKSEAQTARFTFEEQVLHSLHEGGLDIEALETYVKDDVERLGTKLGVVHDRMRSHLSDLLVSLYTKMAPCWLVLIVCSDLLWAITRAQTAWAPSKTAAKSSSKATSRRKSTTTSSGSASWAWPPNSASSPSACHFICCRTACTAPTNPRTKGLSSARVSSSTRRPPTSRFRKTACPSRLASCRTTSAIGCARTATMRLWRTRSCRRNSGFLSRDCRLRGRLVRPASGLFGSSSRRRRRSGSWRRMRGWRSRLGSCGCRCRSRWRMGTPRRRMGMVL